MLTRPKRVATHIAGFGDSARVLVIVSGLTAVLAFRSAPAAISDSLAPAPEPADPSTPKQLRTIEVQATRLGGPGVSAAGSSDYTATQQDILNLPQGENSALSDVLAQMPGVSIDQNQQIHIRDTEGPQFQYRINGVMVPLDINTNPPFLSMINPMFVQRVDLLTGVLPASYSYATGGIVAIDTKDGCGSPPYGTFSILGGQRATFEPSIEQSGCDGRLSYYASALYTQSNDAFSSAAPGPTPYHDATQGGQALSVFGYQISAATRMSLILSGAANDNQLPNVPGLPAQYLLAGTSGPPSQDIDSYLNFRDALAVVAIESSPRHDLTWKLAYSFHTLVQAFRPDDAGELIYQGVASTATHRDVDNSLQGDLLWRLDNQTLGAGFYGAGYSAHIEDTSLVFPVDATGAQTSAVPLQIVNDAQRLNWLSGFYLNDLWTVSPRLVANVGVRWDRLTGFTHGDQVDPTINLSLKLTRDTTVHAGFARYFQVPIFQGISPTAPAAFAGTTAAGPPGAVNPVTEDDYVWDAGMLAHLTTRWSLSQDTYYERTRHYLDTGQFGVVPIFAAFNYGDGHMWGSELGIHYRRTRLSAYGNVTIGRNWQQGVTTGQFNFDSRELAFIDSQAILLDHQPRVGAAAGLNVAWWRLNFGIDGTFSSGLRAGFADQEQLPHVLQINLSVERPFSVPAIGTITDRLSVLNVADRINLIRSAAGIGIFQAAYGARRTIYDTVTVPL